MTNDNKLQDERDTLKARCEKLEGYVRHKQGCGYYIDDEPCTCGLDELLKQGEEG